MYLAAALAVCVATNPGYIENLYQTDSGDDFVTVEWDFVFVEGEDPLVKYSCIVDNNETVNICPLSHCSITINHLEACKEHEIELVPYFSDMASDIYPGEAATLAAYTDDKPVGAPGNLVVVSEDSGTTLKWDDPAENVECVAAYKVCSRREATEESVCQTVTATSATLTYLQACVTYEVTVKPVMVSGKEGLAVETNVTEDGVPGPPTDLVAGNITDSSIELRWNNPVINPACVHHYVISSGPVALQAIQGSHRASEDFENYAAMTHLEARTTYQFDIVSVSKSDEFSTSATVYATTKGPSHVNNFQQRGSGYTEVTLEWDYVEGYPAYPLVKYTLVTNKLVQVDFNCATRHCSYTVDGLEACTEYTFDLIPFFKDPTNDSTFQGAIVSTIAYTNDTPVSAPSNLVIVSEDDFGTTLQWDASAGDCVASYKVCSRLDGSQETVCQTVNGTSTTIATMQGCGTYQVSVSPVTHTGNEGPSLEETITPKNVAPGPPMDLVADNFTDTTVVIMWNNPDVNSLCLREYSITYGQVMDRVSRSHGAQGDYDNYATIGPLEPNTVYIIEIISIGQFGQNSAPATLYVITKEAGRIVDFQQTDSGDGSVTLEWDTAKGVDTIQKYTIITDSDFATDIRCPLSHCSITIDYLEACKEHEFDLIPFFKSSTNGSIIQGDVATTTGYTNDKPVSAPRNLMVVSGDDFGTTLQWEAPAEYPDCVKLYKVCSSLERTQDSVCQTVNGTSMKVASMQTCGTYQVIVTPVTLSGKEGPALEETITITTDVVTCSPL